MPTLTISDEGYSPSNPAVGDAVTDPLNAAIDLPPGATMETEIPADQLESSLDHESALGLERLTDLQSRSAERIRKLLALAERPSPDVLVGHAMALAAANGLPPLPDYMALAAAAKAGKKTGRGCDPRGTDPQQRLAYIYVGNTHIDALTDLVDRRSIESDVKSLHEFFVNKGFAVKVFPRATKDQIMSTLGGARAAAFIGHNDNARIGVDAINLDPNSQSPDFNVYGSEGTFSMDDMIMALNGKSMSYANAVKWGHHVDYAIFHVCQTNNKDLKAITIGNGPGYFWGSQGDWNAFLNYDTGLGLKKLHMPRPYLPLLKP